jgi:hypothetical protein
MTKNIRIYINKIGWYLLILSGIAILTNCINLKSNYIQPKYYKLIQQPINNTEVASLRIDKNIFIKEFDVSAELETSKIAIVEDEKNVKYYNYHH